MRTARATLTWFCRFAGLRSIFLFLLLSPWALSMPMAEVQSTSAQPMNVLLLVMDDVRWDSIGVQVTVSYGHRELTNLPAKVLGLRRRASRVRSVW